MLRRAFLLSIAVASGVVAAGVPAAAQAQPGTATLVAIRAAHHPDYDRLVFEFTGPLPAGTRVEAVPEVIGDASGLPVAVVGDAFLRVVMTSAVGHDDAGNITYGATRRTYALPDIIQVVNAGDYEGVLSFGVGLARNSTFRVFTLTAPSRVVVDIDTPFRTVLVQDYFLDVNRFAIGVEPYTRAVARPVIPPANGRGALQRLFAGPTQEEAASGLAFVNSDATGFTGLSITNGVARVQLVGGCDSHGSTFTIAGEISATLKQFPSVQAVKIYDPAGTTESPNGSGGSIPECLEP